MILLTCLLVSSMWLTVGCQTGWLTSTRSSGMRAAPGTVVATGTPKPDNDNPRDRIAGPGRKVVPPNVADGQRAGWHLNGHWHP